MTCLGEAEGLGGDTEMGWGGGRTIRALVAVVCWANRVMWGGWGSIN